jgi:hypothetical protein
LILADRSPGTALGLLLFGFVVTFGFGGDGHRDHGDGRA